MENSTLPVNDKLSKFMNLSPEEKKQKGSYRSAYFRMFDYPDRTSSIVIEKNQELSMGDDFRDHQGKLHVITEIVSYRPHKGVFENEMNRQKVAIVRSEIVRGV